MQEEAGAATSGDENSADGTSVVTQVVGGEDRAYEELVQLLKSRGLRRVARAICDKLEIDRKDDLLVLTQRDIDGLQLKNWQQTRLLECIQLVKVAVAGAVSIKQGDLDDSEDSAADIV
jgi:hypothetical protein